MALFGPIGVVRARCARWPEFHAAFAYAAQALAPDSPVNARIRALAEGATLRVELPGGAYAVEMAYRTKSRPEGFFETHRKYVDVQVIVAGDESMETAAAAQLDVTQAYDEARDFAKHVDTDAASVLRMRAGDVAVFWPEDAHMPSLAVKNPGLVRKTVVKVPLPAARAVSPSAVAGRGTRPAARRAAGAPPGRAPADGRAGRAKT